MQNQKQLMELYKSHEIEARRHQKDQIAEVKLREINRLKQQAALRNQIIRDQKHSHVMNLQDVEEFRRGLVMADITVQNEKFGLWK